jgi:Tol biopolymer transport system component
MPRAGAAGPRRRQIRGSVATAIDAPARPGRDGTRFAWLVSGLSAWLIAGVVLVLAANDRGLVGDAGFSLYHIPGYAGLLVLGVFAALTVDRAVRRGQPWQRAFPPGYGGVGLGTVVLIAYVLLDLVWRQTFGIGGGVEGSLAPSRLLLPVGLTLIASAPVRAALASPRPGRALLPAVIGTALIAVAASLAILFYNPVVAPWMERPGNARQDDSEIWVMRANGSGQTRLVAAGGGLEMSLPVWSPDGSRLAYTHWKIVDGVDSEAEIWSVAADGSDPRRVVAGPSWNWIPAWSPDGAWIAYTQNAIDEIRARNGVPGPEAEGAPTAPTGLPGAQVWVVSPDGSGARQLTHAAGDNVAASWSSDARTLAFVSSRDGNLEVYVTNLDGTGERRVTNDPGDDVDPAFSPDGHRIAFTSNRTGAKEVWTVLTDGSGLTQVTHDGEGYDVPVWAPDGTRIAFASSRGGNGDVWSMAPDGTDLRNLTNSPSSDDGHWSVSWSHDGRFLAYASAGLPPAAAQPIAREDLGVAAILLTTVVLAAIAIVLARLAAPLGSFGFVLGIYVAFAATIRGEWRFLPAAIVGGLLVDLALRFVPARYRARVAAAALPGIFVVGIGTTLAAEGRLGWTPTLWLGVSAAAGFGGWALAELVERLGPADRREPADRLAGAGRVPGDAGSSPGGESG